MILSPNVPFKLFPGSFDGFPTGCCIEAGLAGVAVFCTDELKLNTYFTNHQDICLISKNKDEICDLIRMYFKDLDSLYLLSRNCQKSFKKVFDLEKQMSQRVKIISECL